MDKYEIDFYEKENGEAPAEEFIRSLDAKMKAKVFRVLDMLEINGPALRMPHSENIEDGIFEIRAKQGSDISRVLYFFYIGKKIILTNGFIKKSQKTPSKEIALAKKYRADYERRYGNEQI